MGKDSQRLVAGLAGALGCALLTIAFLLGRMTAKPDQRPQPPLAASVQPAAVVADETPGAGPASAEPGPGTTQRPQSTPIPSAQSESLPGTTPAVLPGLDAARSATPAGGGVRTDSAGSPERQQIAAYFDRIDQIDGVDLGDPQAFASTLVQSVSSGDFSGIDNLTALARRQGEYLRGITPPPACREHHRLAIALTSDSAAMMERLKAAISTGDTTALLAMATTGRDLEAQANRLKALSEAIKQQAGH